MSSPPPLPHDNGVEYRSRTSALDKEQNLILENNNLVVVSDHHATETLPLSALSEITLRFFPSRFQRNRFECLLRWQDGRRMKIVNQFYAGMADFKDQSSSYNAWVQELNRLAPKLSPACHYRTGVGMVRYLLNAAVITGVFLLLLLVVFLMWSSMPAIVIIKLLIIIFYGPVLVKWFRRNKPGTYHPNAIPTNILP